ncbi:hypothetical protein CANMA_002008 [Candida margitis]|uniref:uncharacterized protein n=1 Tax=Candida margitis TaxID=1775924 RepID=UPI00222787E6|nr:uncharacterized protein CANMA_002008 [Candida margitis]KAI5969012.1 hypothetical protein CANMA_002008 [Candida margitis]
MGSSSISNGNNATAVAAGAGGGAGSGVEEDLPPPSYEEAVKTSAPPISSSSTQTSRPNSRPAATRPQQQTHPSHSHSHSHSRPPAPAPPSASSGLPFTYPKGYYCRKCNSTGYKLKNGKTCQDCWEKFSPRNSTNSVNYNFHPQYFGSTTFIPYGSAPVPNPHPGGRGGGSGGFFSTASTVPLRVPPGDPRLGGVLCGRCRGSGMVRFLLDMELCPVCSGLGRVVNVPAGPPPRGHMQGTFGSAAPQAQYSSSYYGDRKR